MSTRVFGDGSQHTAEFRIAVAVASIVDIWVVEAGELGS